MLTVISWSWFIVSVILFILTVPRIIWSLLRRSTASPLQWGVFIFSLSSLWSMWFLFITSFSYQFVKVIDVDKITGIVTVIPLEEYVQNDSLVTLPLPASPPGLRELDFSALFRVDSSTLIVRDPATGKVWVVLQEETGIFRRGAYYKAVRYKVDPIFFELRSSVKVKKGDIYLIKTTNYNFPYFNAKYPTIVLAIPKSVV